MIRRERTKSATAAPLPDLVLASCRETELLGSSIGRLLQEGQVLALMGELGAGKTALVRGIMVGLGVSESSVSSPTFTLVNHYHARLPFIHIDLYRLRSPEEAEAIGLSEYFTDHAVTAIEWADRFPSLLPTDRFVVRLTHLTPTTRKVRFEAQGPRSRLLLAQIRKAWRPIRPSRLSQPNRRSNKEMRRQ